MPPGPDGLEVLRVARQLNPLSYVVVMTGFYSNETAIESIRSGAFNYITKPFKLAQIEIVANRIVEHLTLSKGNKRLLQNLAMVTEKSALIESLLSRLVANPRDSSKMLTQRVF